METNQQLISYLADCQTRVNRGLDSILPAADLAPTRLHEAMRYAVLGAGKRIRPTLTYAGARAVGAAPEQVQMAACAVELIHAYSLIHDDLPAMDDDDLRRGRPTCHKAFDEATAILAGDALQTLAFQILANDGANPEPVRVRMIENLARASGSRGMVGGQALDLAAEGAQLDLEALETIHRHKTGALISASVTMAAMARPQLPPEQLASLEYYARCIGLAFQVQDDLLDIEGATEVIGKRSGQDASHHKATYPALLGIEQAHATAHQLVDEALASLRVFGDRAEPLRWIAHYIIERTH